MMEVMEKDDGFAFIHADSRGLWNIQGEMKTADTRTKDTDLILGGYGSLDNETRECSRQNLI